MRKTCEAVHRSRRSRAIDAVQVYGGTWVSGRRAVAQLGAVEVSVFVADRPLESRATRMRRAERRLLDLLRERAEAAEANAVLAVEICVDLFARRGDVDGTHLRATGSAVKLEPPRGAESTEAGVELEGLLQ